MDKMRTRRLGDLINFKRGYDLPESKRTPGPYPVISSAGISGYHNDYKATGTGVVTGRYGTLGQMYYVDGKYWPHNTALYVTDFKGNDSKYIYYLLKCLGKIHTSDKSSVPGVNRNELHEMAVPTVEDAVEQQKISAILSDLDAKIEINNRINAELEAMAKFLYDYWFVQFDFPDENKKPYKTSGGQMVYNSTLKREIPAGWQTRRLAELVVMVRRGISPKYVEDGGVSVLNQKCIREQRVSFEPSRRHGATVAPSDLRVLKLGDVLVNSTGVGTLGRVAFIKRLEEKVTLVDSHVTIVRGNDALINKEYLIFSMLRAQPEIEKAAEGSTGQVELRQSYLEELDVIVPDKNSQIKFSAFVTPLITRIASCEFESQHLTRLRDWLLPLLMNGQVTVK